eukprot:jgi/Mesen1/3517/ME000197S02538
METAGQEATPYIVATESEQTSQPAAPEHMSQASDVTVGIDLGTATSSVAYWQNGRVEVIHTSFGSTHLLSHVFFSGESPEQAVGGAMSGEQMCGGSVIFDAKRLVGHVDSDPVVQRCAASWPFQVQTLGIGVKPHLAALRAGMWRSTTAEEVLAIILMELKSMAEQRLGQPVFSCVLTMPASFSRFQQAKLERVCQLAGLKALRVMPEPSAAALVYAQQQQAAESGNMGSGVEKYALIFNFGAGHMDVAVAATAGGFCQIKALAAEAVGGDDIALLMAQHLAHMSQVPYRIVPFPTVPHRNMGSGVEKYALIFNFGAGHMDVAVAATAGGFCQIKALAAEAVGGDDIALLMAQHLAHMSQKEAMPGGSAMAGRQAMCQLRFASAQAMKTLSTATLATIQVPTLGAGGGSGLQVTLSREEFERIAEPILTRAVALVDQALADAKVDEDSLADVILVGGASAIPRFRALLREKLKRGGGGSDGSGGSGEGDGFYDFGFEHAEVVAYGAALEAAVTSGLGNNLDLLTIQAMPLSLGVAVAGGAMHVILARNSTIPARRETVLTTTRDNQEGRGGREGGASRGQATLGDKRSHGYGVLSGVLAAQGGLAFVSFSGETEVLIQVYEGESSRAADNHLLGFFLLSSIPPLPRGAPVISVCMDVDASDTLRVVAGAYVAGRDEPVAPLVEVRMPTVEDGHRWCMKSVVAQYGEALDVRVMEEPGGQLAGQPGQPGQAHVCRNNLDLLTIQAMPLSLGVAVAGGAMHVILARNSTIPARRETVLTTTRDNQEGRGGREGGASRGQATLGDKRSHGYGVLSGVLAAQGGLAFVSFSGETEVLIQVYEGESSRAADNHLLGFFLLSSIPPLPRGAPVISVCMDVDASDTLRVVAGAYVAGRDEPVAPLVEVRMPTVEDGHRWCMKSVVAQYGEALDVRVMEEPGGQLAGQPGQPGQAV